MTRSVSQSRNTVKDTARQMLPQIDDLEHRPWCGKREKVCHPCCSGLSAVLHSSAQQHRHAMRISSQESVSSRVCPSLVWVFNTCLTGCAGMCNTDVQHRRAAMCNTDEHLPHTQGRIYGTFCTFPHVQHRCASLPQHRPTVKRVVHREASLPLLRCSEPLSHFLDIPRCRNY